MQITKKIKQDSYTKANKSDEEAQKKPWEFKLLFLCTTLLIGFH